MTKYLLSSFAHLWTSDEAGVLLDLRRDKYIGLTDLQMSELSRFVDGWPSMRSSGQDKPDAVDAAAASSAVDGLIAAGLLTCDAARGRPATPESLRTASSSLLCFDPSRLPRLRVRGVMALLTVAALAKASSQLFSLETIFNRLHRARTRIQRDRPDDPARLKELVAEFLAVRPLIYTHRKQCLFDSIVLTGFLHLHGIAATLVIGVKTHPFGAHAWVQYDDYLLNDFPEHALRYSPIVAI